MDLKLKKNFDRFTSYLRKGRGFNSSNETISLAPVTAHHTRTNLDEAFTMSHNSIFLKVQGK